VPARRLYSYDGLDNGGVRSAERIVPELQHDGNSRLHFTKIRTYALNRLALFVAKRHHRASRFGWVVVHYQSPDHMGLINLDRLVVTPSPSRDWRVKRAKPNAGGEGRR
jgi:hypothetical protein